MLPNFLIVGAMKAGTTSLYEYLRNHPQVFMPERKELHYFSIGVSGGLTVDWYEQWFDEADGKPVIGEASTSYSKFPTYGDVPARIAALLPKARLVYVIRHPIERMRSQWIHETWTGEESRPIDEALMADSRYVDYSRYAFQITRYLSRYPRDQLLIVRAEDLRSSRRETLERVFRFLDVDSQWWSPVLENDFHISQPKRRPSFVTRKLRQHDLYKSLASRAPSFVKTINRRAMTRPLRGQATSISGDLCRRLETLLRDDIRELRGLLGSEFDGWGLA